MKSHLHIAPAPGVEIKHPVLARHKSTHLVVLSESDESYTVLCVGATSYKIGGKINKGIPLFDLKEWEILPPNSVVTLTV